MNVFIATVNEGIALLNSEESWHCARVLRARPGASVSLIDGSGNFYEGRLETVSDKKCTAVITKGPFRQAVRNYYLHLAVSPTKHIDRIEWMVEKAVETGVDEISFFTSKNSERTSVKKERMTKIVESAVKQSLQATIPKVNEMVPLRNLFELADYDQKLIAHCYELPKSDIRKISFRDKKSLVLVGPEGDFTMQEVQQAEEHHFNAVTLGRNRLRTETAGLYVCLAASLLSE
jgi:16S rRNA (uracil1498-N3)-methyltransferase